MALLVRQKSMLCAKTFLKAEADPAELGEDPVAKAETGPVGLAEDPVAKAEVAGRYLSPDSFSSAILPRRCASNF